MAQLKNRYDFVLVFDVKDGNPNGDPDAGNLPRLDPETGQGLVTDVCLKRKVRNYVALTRANEPGYGIFIREKAILNNLISGAYEKLGIEPEATAQDKKGSANKKKTDNSGENVDKAREQMCKDYFDVRTFGAVMSTGKNAGQVRGPVQLTFARSIEPIVTLEHSITRCAVATEEESKNQSGGNRTMGRKNTVPYGLYIAYGFVSPALAKQTGFSQEDLDVLFEALKNMFEHDHSAARGMMTVCKFIVFKHESELGNAHANKLFDLVKITNAKEDGSTPPRSFSDYVVSIQKDELPEGVEILEMV